MKIFTLVNDKTEQKSEDNALPAIVYLMLLWTDKPLFHFIPFTLAIALFLNSLDKYSSAEY